MDIDFRRQTVEELAAAVRRRELSARDLVDRALERILVLNRRVNAFCAVDEDRARADAAALDERTAAGHDPGPLAGIPIGVKDLEDAIGFTTTYGSALLVDAPPAQIDSPQVARLRAAGCIVVGKTNTPEYGHKGVTDNPTFGLTANPWSLEHSAGGSSGGTAAAIAAGMIPLGTGTDGGGSIRLPASVCGQSGLKCSQGRVPVGGPTPAGSGVLSVKGPMARTTRDVALALDACVGPDPSDIFSHPAPPGPWRPALREVGASANRPTRVLWCPNLGFGTVDRDVLAVCEAAVQRLAASGVEVVPVDVVFDDDPIGPWLTLWTAARFRTHGHLRGTPDWERLSPSLWPQIEAGAKVTGADYAVALDQAHLLNWRLDQTLAELAPVLLCPTVAGRPPRVDADGQGLVNGEATPAWVQFTPVFNLTRNPAGTVCAGLAPDGLPVGLQVVGRQLDDEGVLATMAALEDAIGFDQLAPLPGA